MLLACALLPAGADARAWRLQAMHDGQPVADAVLSLHARSAANPGALAVMDQRDTRFVPGVLAVQVGTAVSFPNSDTVRHQVYSFSPVRPFELPLYSGTPPEPIVFDRPGVVVVGCNIHDWMIGHIVVLDTPYFALTGADGSAVIEAPDGDYELRAWHARLPAGAAYARAVSGDDAGATIGVELALGPPPPERRGSDRLRALQERLRRVRDGD